MGWKFGETFIYIKAYLYALVLTVEELRKLIDKSRTKQRGRLMVVYYIQSSQIMNALVIYNQMRYIIYKHLRGAFSVVHSKMIFLICYLLDYQQVHDNANVSIILLGDKKEPTK